MVIVTAERRAESLQKVPAQIDVFNAQQIAQRGIKSTADFVAEIPNMTFDRADTYHNSWVVVRGIASVTNADSPIAVVVDGVPEVDQKQFTEQLFDIEDIQVLKGPQGACSRVIVLICPTVAADPGAGTGSSASPGDFRGLRVKLLTLPGR